MNKKGIQKAIRQMILIGVIIGAIMAATGDHTASYAAASFLVGLLLSPVAWGALRLLRFVISPIRPAQ